MPKLDAIQAKQVIVELLRAAGGAWTGKTKLYKAFYLAHLYYAENEPGYLTNWPVVRMPNGPGIDAGDELLEELELTGIIARDAAMVGPYHTSSYRLTGKKLPAERLAKKALEAIRVAVEFVQTKSATELSDLTHEFSRSWLNARDGQHLNIYIDLIEEDEFARREQSLETLHRDLVAAWTSDP
ncbi:MAG TPA: type II toxin-antitoxin system antitoxin SocA domain-containing protein [Gemmataceae bacterium]|nr:type II toxin-antitoxin system antitoxin SocA domain-containing protein [Gemmataceae bacterium]